MSSDYSNVVEMSAMVTFMLVHLMNVNHEMFRFQNNIRAPQG